MKNSEQLAQQLLEQISNASSQAIEAMLTKAYDDGYRDGLAANPTAPKPQLSADIEVEPMDLGLPSGTIWLRPKGAMSIQKAMQCGLKLPTEEQIKELQLCKFSMPYFKYVVCGANGEQYDLSEVGTLSMLIADSDKVNEDLHIVVRHLKYSKNDQKYMWLPEDHFVGDKVLPLFVMPKPEESSAS